MKISICGFKWILIFIFLATTLSVIAQKESEIGLPFIKNYYPKDYDAPPQTWAIMEDNDGLMYFGIQGGILQYDGVKWKKVNFDSAGQTTLVRAFAKDKQGRVYYGGYGDIGYLGMDKLGHTVAKSLLKNVPVAYRNFFDVWTINISSEGIYFQSREEIIRLQPVLTGGKESWKVKVWKPQTKFMYAFLPNGNYYIHQQGLGLFQLMDDSLHLIPGSEFLGKERVQIMLPYNVSAGKGKIEPQKFLVGMFYSGLYLFDGNTFTPFKTDADSLIKSGLVLYKGIRLRNGNFALSTTGRGLVIIDHQGKLVQKINRSVGLQDESVYATYLDDNGTLWLAMDNGISRVETASPLTQFTVQSGITTSVLSLARFEGSLYVGSTNGLLKYNNARGLFDLNNQIPQTQVFWLIQDGSKLLIAADGLFAIQRGNTYTVRNSLGGNLTLSTLYKLPGFPDYLLGGTTSGIVVFQKNSTSKTPADSWDFKGFIPGIHDQIWTLAWNKDSTLWAGTQSGYIFLLHFPFDETGNPVFMKPAIEKFGPEKGLINASGSVFPTKQNAYFLSDSSIYVFNKQKQRFVPDTTFGSFHHGGGNDGFIKEDSLGRVWVRFGKETRLAIPQAGGGYIVKDVLQKLNDRSFSDFYSEKDGITWIGTTDGLVRYDERIPSEDNYKFKTLLRYIAAGKDTLGTNVASDKNDVPKISFQNNSLRLEYAAPFYDQEEKIKYRTWLEGFQRDWSDWGNNSYKEYTNLPAGKYRFHVRALNIYNKESDEAIYEFIILAPWYATWWAYLLYAVLFLFAGYLILRSRTENLKKKHRELEKTVEERTSQLSQRVTELAVINSVQEALVSEMDMKGIYNLVGERIRNTFDAQAVIIATFNHQADTESFQYAVEKGQQVHPDSRPFDNLRKELIHSRKSILIKEKEQAYAWFKKTPGIAGTKPLLSGIFTPLLLGEKVTGYISLQNVDREHAFFESDVKLLETLANSMSVALENARLFDETNRLLKETEQRNAELAVINSVQESLVAKLDMSGIYELVGEKIRQIFNAQVIDIVTYDEVKNVIADQYAYEKGDRTLLGERQPKGFRKHVIETGALLLHNKDVVQAAEEFNNELLIGDMPKSQVYVPMIADGKVKGIISLQNLDHEQAFSASDVSLLTTLSNSMSVALESARLFDETTRLLKETEQRTTELAVINSVQDGLAKEMDMQAIYDLVGNRIRDVFNAQVAMIATLDEATKMEEFKYIIEKGGRVYSKPRPYDKLRQHLIDTGEKILINNNYEEAASRFGLNVLPGTEHPKSLLFVPMIIGDKVKSYVSLQNIDEENAFSDSDVRLLETLANSMSVALENARLFDETNRLLKETEQKTSELAVINSVQDDLVREMKLQRIYDLVGNRICELFDTQTVVIRTFDHNEGMEEWQYAIERGERLQSEPRPLIWANKYLIKNKKSLFINDNYEQFAVQHGGKGVTKGLPPKSAVFVPMIVGDVVRGSVSLQNVEKENAFSETDLRLLTTLTNSMSVALENARLFDETTHLLADAKQRATELATVNSISKALASQLNPDDLVKLVGDQLRDLFNANIVYLALLNKKTQIIQFPYQYGDNMPPLKLGEGLTSSIILKGEPMLINKDVTELTTQLGISRVGLAAASYLGVPIPVGEEIIGVLSVQSTEQENRFNENDLRLLSTIASSVGVALKNAQLFEDVEQAKMEAELSGKNAEKANEAKSAFLSTVSHELRTPLTSVLGFAKIIKKRLEDKIFTILDRSDKKVDKTVDQISENLNVVISEGERLTHLINDVLDLAKIEAGKMEWNQENVSLAEVIERAIAATTSLFDQKNIKLEKHIESEIPPIVGDRDKLIQVVINLFSNAVKFTEKGRVSCRLFQVKDEVIVSVTDTGIGIAKEDFGAVFEQFKQVGGDTLTDKPKGTGLGLPICKEIIEHHDGRIWVDSNVGKGSTFSFAIPVNSSGKNNATPIHFNALMKQLKEQMVFSKLKMNGNHATILVVDDDDSIRSLLQQELSDAGYIIEEANDGKMALEAIRRNRPDLIILDVMMPEINGFDVAAILKNDPQTMDIPIIILSIVQDKARGFRIGVDRYLTKPIDTAKLFEEVGSLLEQGKSKKKVMVVDQDTTAVRSLTEVLQAKGYIVVESDGAELVEKAISAQPDIIILNSVLSDKNKIVQSLRFEKGLENVLFLMYQ